MPQKYLLDYFFRLLALTILSIALLQHFKSPSNMNTINILDLKGHINAKPIPKSKTQSCMNYSSLESVLFEKLHSIKLSQPVLIVTTFFQFNPMKAALSIILHYMHDFDKHLKTLFSNLVTNNNFDHRSYDTRQHILTYLALLKLCTDEFTDDKFQIMHLTSQVDNIFVTLDQTNTKHTKRGTIHSLFNFFFGHLNSAEEINAIKNNMAILEENQAILSSQVQKTFNFVNLMLYNILSNRMIFTNIFSDRMIFTNIMV